MSLIAPCGNSTFTNEDVQIDEANVRLLVGAKNPAGTGDIKILYERVSLDDVKDLAGRGSVLALSYEEYRVENPFTRIDMFMVEANAIGSTPSTASILFGGTALHDGAISIDLFAEIGGTAQSNKGNGHISIAITTGEDEIAIATKFFLVLQSVLTLDDPYTVVDDGAGLLTFTATQDSAVFDSMLISVTGQNSIGGVTVVVSAWEGGLASYTLDPQEIETEIEDLKYRILWVNNDIDIGIMQSILEPRKAIACNSNIAGTGISAMISNFADINDNYVPLYRSDIMAIIVDNEINPNGSVPSEVNPSLGTPSFILASAFASVQDLREVSGAILTNIMSNTNTDAQVGDHKTLALPYHNTILNNIPFRKDKRKNGYSADFTKLEKRFLANNGLTILQCDTSTSKINLGGVPTTSFPTTGLWVQDIEKELFLQSTLFEIASGVAKQTGFTEGKRPAKNNAFLTVGDVQTFFLKDDGFFSDWRDMGLLDTKQSSIDITDRSLIVTFDAATDAVFISYRTILSRTLREYTITAVYGKGE